MAKLLCLVAVVAVLAFLSASCPAQAPQGLAPWAAKAQPGDTPKKSFQEITKSDQKYTVTQGGTIDGRNSRGPMGCGMAGEGACEQSWESNRLVRMENIGDTDVVNPWLSNGRNNFRTVEDMVAWATAGLTKDSEKAYALWFQEICHRYHWNGNDNNELCDPVKVRNVYGFNTCGNDSICMAGQFHAIGLKAAPARAVGHCISQAFYDNAWHFLDGDLHAVYLMRDNSTVAGELDFVRDHDLIKRTHTQGILTDDNRAGEEHEASMYSFEGAVNGERNAAPGNMNMTLRPGEALVWRWGHLNPPRVHGSDSAKYPDTICNGLWEYRPDFTKETWRKGALTADGVKKYADGIGAEPGKNATIVWAVKSPYIFVGGHVESEGKGAKFAFSTDGRSWTDVADSFDRCITATGPACYQFQVRCTLAGDARLKKVGIVGDVQMALMALPEMGVGANNFTYTDATTGDRKVRVTHEWVERSSSKPPVVAASPVSPADSGESSGTDVVFKWAPAEGASDYHFELSARSDMRYPLSMSFYKLISRTADKGKPQYTLLYPGLLTPDTKYYWHVRAKDARGTWGPWSKTWSFTPKGPGYPLEVAVQYDADKNKGTLKWKANPVGRKPAKFRVYGSDEKGFSVSDKPYAVNTGSTRDLANPFPANFIAETSAGEMVVLGPDAPAGKAFYRVVAVDDQGKLSGPSDYAAAPRPVIFTKPVTTAKVGAAYKYDADASRSIGDLTMRSGGSSVGFFDVEKPKFSLAQKPDWLSVDAATGVLTGTPAAAGKFDVVLTATIDREVRKLDENQLKWGNDVATGTTNLHVGSATQKFTIEVKP